jgi:HAD superfamily hydrolase (TIGR01509 family)
MKRSILVFLSLFILSFPPTHADGQATPATDTKQLAIIFDLGGVVLETKSATQFIGIPKLLAYAMTQNPVNLPQNLRKALFDFYNEVHERHPHEVNAQDDHGHPLPQCMCNWMKGTHTPAEIREAIDEKIALRERSIENSIIHAISHMMFTPEKMAQTQHLVPETVNLIKELKEHGYKIYVLSNFCSESFNLIRERNPEFFALFDGIVISADIGMIKPDPNIYHHILTTHNIDPKMACFIDDQKVNLEAAQKFGIHTIHCPAKSDYFYGKSPDIETVREKLQTWQDSFQTASTPAIA